MPSAGVGEVTWLVAIAAMSTVVVAADNTSPCAADANLFDCVYFSASVYTTVGFCDIVPIGPIRTMSGTEGITGLVMITWSASFALMEMLKNWNEGD